MDPESGNDYTDIDNSGIGSAGRETGGKERKMIFMHHPVRENRGKAEEDFKVEK